MRKIEDIIERFTIMVTDKKGTRAVVEMRGINKIRFIIQFKLWLYFLTGLSIGLLLSIYVLFFS